VRCREMGNRQDTMDEVDEFAYAGVLAQFYSLCDGQAGRGDANRESLQVFWQLGRQLVEYEGQRWGARLVRRLSADLTERYGDGFSTSNLFSMRKFALLYAVDDIDGSLRWSHYRVLVTVADSAQRRELARQVREGAFTCRSLAVAASRVKPGRGIDWTLRPGRTGLYRYEKRADGSAVLDGGFGLKFSPEALGLQAGEAALTPGAVVAVRDGRLELVEGVADAYRHSYEGRVIRLIDGDTVLVELVRAPGVFANIRVRLRQVDAVELAAREGETAVALLAGILSPGERVVVQTYGLDTHGRWIADVLAGEGDEVVAGEDGGFVYVNKALTEAGFDEMDARTW